MGRPRKTTEGEVSRILAEAAPRAAEILVELMDSDIAAGTRASIAQEILARACGTGKIEDPNTKEKPDNFKLTLKVIEPEEPEGGTVARAGHFREKNKNFSTSARWALLP